MDQIRIGKFIAEMRKEQNMTQMDLANQLGISNKTVSKWETGNGMPDYAIMEPLCTILKINANELLSGERVPSSDYNRKAEENIMSLMQENSEGQKKALTKNISIIVGAIGLLFSLSWMIMISGGRMAFSFFVDLPTVLACCLMVSFMLMITGQWKMFWNAFRCLYKVEVQLKEIEEVSFAVKTGMMAFLLSGSLMSLTGTVICFAMIEDMEALLVNLAVALLGIIFGLFMDVILLAVYARLKIRRLELM